MPAPDGGLSCLLAQKDQLNQREQAFVAAYLELGNATKAAVEAGYSEATARQQGSRLLSKADVRDAVAAGRQALAEQSLVTREMIEAELAAIAFSDARGALSWEMASDGEGREYVRLKLVPSDELTREQAAALAEVRLSERGFSVKRHDKLKALELLARMKGLFQDTVRHELPGAIEVKLSFDAGTDA